MPKSSYDSSQYKRLGYVLVLLLLIVGGYWASIRFMTRDLVDNRMSLSSYMSYHVSDPFGGIRSDRRNTSQDFQSLSNWSERKKIDESKVYWFRFSMKEAGLTDPEEEFFVEMREKGRTWTLFSMRLFIEVGNELKELGQTGYEVPAEDRSYTRGGFILPLEWDKIPEGADRVYLRTTVRNGFYPHFYLWNDHGSLERFKIRINGMVFFNFGVLLSILVYLVVLLGVLKNRLLGYYLVYVLIWIVLIFSFWLAQEGFWPVESRRWLTLVAVVGTAGSYFFLFLFTYHFLELEKFLPKVSRLFPFFTVLNGLSLVLMLVALFLDHDRVLMMIFMWRELIFGVFLIGTGACALFAGIRQALFYNASFTLILGSQIVNHLVRVEVLPPWPFPFSELPTSDNVLVLGTLLFSFAIADGMLKIQRQRDTAQAESMDRLKQLNEVETKAKEALEVQVQEKTRHLEVEIERAHNAEAALENALVGETKASNAKSEFLANMSHELRTPLNAILGYAQLIGNPDYDQQKRKRAGEVIQQSGNHLLELINDVLNLSKVEAGRIELQPEAYNLPEMVKELVNMMEIHAGQKGLLLNYCCGDSVPRAVQGDRRYLRQILINLLSNAIKFTDRGTIELSVEMDDATPNTVCIQVADTGRGIEVDKWETIFEPFRQVTGEKENIQGTGLGLAISRRLARLMGGDVTVESEVGKGSNFRVTIPLPQAVAYTESILPLSEKRIVGFEGPSKHILIVDDEELNREVIREFLEPLGFVVTEADSAETALKMLNDEMPDLLIVDLIMPGMDGFELTSRIRSMETTHNLLLLASSARISPEDSARSIKLGCNAFLPKPISVTQLHEQLGELLGCEWIIVNAEPRDVEDSEDHLSGSIIDPPLNQLEALRKSAESGYVQGIRDALSDLGKQDSEYFDFVQRVEKKLRQFDIDGIIELIDKSGKQSDS